MNYRHHFHAGNFADVFKHALLVQLVRAMQRKPAGMLLLDTHAGAGAYDLTRAGAGDTRPREPEHPGGIGRLWRARDLPPALREYGDLVRGFQKKEGAEPRDYPGSPWFLRRLAREQDRVALCERESGAFEELRREFPGARILVQQRDGYGALSALLPPPEKRALALIDPPFESGGEWEDLAAALGAGLRRLPAGLFAVWYPLTARAGKVDALAARANPSLPPTLAVEMTVDPQSPGLKGCGLVIVNPPWRFEAEAEPWLRVLTGILATSPGAGLALRWLVPE